MFCPQTPKVGLNPYSEINPLLRFRVAPAKQSREDGGRKVLNMFPLPDMQKDESN